MNINNLFSVLPEQPIVLDQWGRQLNGTMLGPKLEGDNVMITCRVVGGEMTNLFSHFMIHIYIFICIYIKHNIYINTHTRLKYGIQNINEEKTQIYIYYI